MKRLAAFLIIIFILAIQMVVFAVELSSATNSGDRVSLFGDVSVDNKSQGDIVAVAGNISINASVDGDLAAVIGSINAFKGSTGTLIAVFGNINVQDDVKGDVITVFGDTVISGRVSGQVITVLGKLKLNDNAQVENGIVAIGGVEISNSAKVQGDQNIVGLGFLQNVRIVFSLLIMLLSGFTLLIGLIVIRFAKLRFENISIGIENSLLRKTLWGLVSILGITILLPILSITIIAPILYFLLLILSGIVSSILVGKLIIKMFNSYPNIYLEFSAGLILLSSIKFILIIFVFQNGLNLLVFGGISLLFSVLINSAGIGILLDTRFGSEAFKSINTK